MSKIEANTLKWESKQSTKADLQKANTDAAVYNITSSNLSMQIAAKNSLWPEDQILKDVRAVLHERKFDACGNKQEEKAVDKHYVMWAMLRMEMFALL